jgi:LacI family transcriptional regulator
MISKIRLVDIAKKANVSLGTVDRVVNNRGKVAPETEKNIRRILNEFDYQTNLMASSLSSKKRPVFTVLVPKPQGEDYWYKILSGIETTEKTVIQFGVKITKLLYDQDDNIQFANLASQILKTQCEGVLLAPLFHKEAKGFVHELEKENIPYVVIDSPIEGAQSLCSISQDYFQSGVLAAKLIDYGLDKNDELLSISNLMYADYIEHVRERLDGLKYFFETLTTKKRSIHFLEIVNPKFEKLAVLLKEELLRFPKIKGIFIDNSKAHWVGRILEENNIAEIKVIGFDLIEQNIRYLQNGIIDFILFDYAENQGEQGLQILFDHVVKKKVIVKRIKMPIYIITKENLEGFLPDHPDL